MVLRKDLEAYAERGSRLRQVATGCASRASIAIRGALRHDAVGLRGVRSGGSTAGTIGTTAFAAGVAEAVETPSCCSTPGTLRPSASSC
jgi:hypothetical protein